MASGALFFVQVPSFSLSPLTSSFSSHSFHLHLHLPHSHLSSLFTFIARPTAPLALKPSTPTSHQTLLRQPSSNSPPPCAHTARRTLRLCRLAPFLLQLRATTEGEPCSQFYFVLPPLICAYFSH